MNGAIIAGAVKQGKATGDPFIVRGGYNCRHHWQPVDPEWFNDSEIDND